MRKLVNLCLFVALCFAGRGQIQSCMAQEYELPFEVPVEVESLPKKALIKTTQGVIEIEFYTEEAPITVRNFEFLGKKGFYEDLTFHRYVANFVIQGGDPLGNGKGGPGYALPPEYSESLKHKRGTLGMARLPSQVNPERLSSGSQFYITFNKSPHLDGLYTVFARVVSGIENAEKLRKDDKILEVQFPR